MIGVVTGEHPVAAGSDATGSDVIVIGGGVIGLSVAWRSAGLGATVTVVDPLPGRGAGWAAAGMLAPVGEAHFGEAPLTGLNLVAAGAWPDFSRQLENASGRSVGYLETGSLLVALDGSDRLATDDLLDSHLELALPARRLSAHQCRELEPLLVPGISGGAELCIDHQVDNRLFLAALLAACRSAGVAFVGQEATEVFVTGDRVGGVGLGSGQRMTAETVVVAAGCRSGQIGGLPETVRPPVRPVKGLTLRLRARKDLPVLRRTVRGLVRGRGCYLVPRRDGTLVVGATVEERGFDASVQAGAVGDLLDSARRLVPAVEEYELTDTTTGLRPGTPDNAPIVGPTAIVGLLMATGHYRNGILLAPITADAIGALALGASADADRLAPFARFPTDRFGP